MTTRRRAPNFVSVIPVVDEMRATSYCPLPGLVLAFVASLARSQEVEDLGHFNCIEDPAEYWATFVNSKSPRCVSSRILVTIQGPCECELHPGPCINALSSGGPKDDHAWINDNGSLEDYLRFSHASPDDRWAATAAMLAYVGLPKNVIRSDCRYRLILIDRDLAEAKFHLFVPTFADWLEQLRRRYGLDYNTRAQKEVILSGWMRFDELTGCKNRTVVPAGVCGQDFEEARTLLQYMNATRDCVEAFSGTYQGGLAASGAHLRGLLFFCASVNELCSGLGYGWNGISFTGAEYVMDNVHIIDDLGSTPRELWNPQMHKLRS